jgi:predicted nucleic acid-binding Zn finger protein
MPATFTEVLEPTATHKNRALTWMPAATGVGVLTVTDSRIHVRYGVCELPVGKGFSGRAVKLSKADGEVYCVRVGERAGDDHCDCKGFSYGRGKPCKHISALAALLENGWLDELETVSDRAAEIEEKDSYYAARGI